MGVDLKINSVNKISKGVILFAENEKTTMMCMLVQGKILVQKRGVHVEIMEGDLFAISDVCIGQYQCTYSALEPSLVYAFPGNSEDAIHTFLSSNPEYRGIMIASLCKEVMKYTQQYQTLVLEAKNIFNYLNQHYTLYSEHGDQKLIPEDYLEKMPKEILSLTTNEEEISFYAECGKLSLDVQKDYYNHSENMAEYQAKKIAVVIEDLLQGCENVFDYIEEAFHYFINETGTGLYDNEVKLALTMKRQGAFQVDYLKRINETKDKIINTSLLIQKKVGITIPVNKDKLEELLLSVLMEPSGTAAKKEKAVTEIVATQKCVNEKDSPKQLEHSLQQILDFSQVTADIEENFKETMEVFFKTEDKLSTKEEMRRLRKEIAGQFYEVYMKCMWRAFQEETMPKPVELFLDFGFVDERLLTAKQLLFLSNVTIENIEGPCNVYTMSEWLKAVYEGRKEPSRNEFDQTYKEQLREMRKNKAITEAQEKELLEDSRKKFEFEVQNMVRYNSKVVNGQLSTFVPILHKDIFYGVLDKLYLTKRKLVESLLEVEKLDFSAFYRSVLYVNPELKIEKEYIMKKVYPDMILMPVYGTTASMWQEIGSRKRDTPARFLFPIFTDTSLNETMVKMFGRYRWEFCRCEQGTTWNNIQYKSLTSEYMDYIQYYKKNRSLTEEKRNKIKAQIQRGRNNSREIFVIDYDNWIRGEAVGAMKMNKVARELLATYCPFEKPVREELEKNNAFAEAMARQKREFAKSAHEYDLKIRQMEKKISNVPDEIRETYQFYSEM